MNFKFLKRYQILFFILFFLLSTTIIILTIKSNKTDKLNTSTTEVKKENKVLDPKPKTEPTTIIKTKKKIETKKKIPITKKELIDISPLFSNDNLLDSKPLLEIDQIMVEQEKINTFTKDKYSIEKKKDWKVDYEVGLDDGAIDDLKTDPSLKPDIIKGKVEFSKSF
ncbi:hypothetical protein [Sulfurimonas sp.]|uniref:hypothetical protein n=1 Tax=Sulfurimonas sp. TaxID=2022749 RepID=UPI0025FA3B07|nr:hypothetical protein [Sulfurimonas sp.]